MLKKFYKIGLLLITSLFIGSFLCSSLSFSQEMPKPGTTIDKSNYQQYAHLFPEEFGAPAFENGFDGLLPTFKVVVAEAKHYPIPKAFLDYSAKNRGKYVIDESGNITPFFPRQGLPFPDLQPTDQAFILKLMWNFDNKYMCDDLVTKNGPTFEKRRGEPIRLTTNFGIGIYYKNRIVGEPKPDLPNPLQLFKSNLFKYLSPAGVRNTINLLNRYVDTAKSDDSYLYLPSLRRVLRAEANQRSTPIMGSVGAPDDFGIFDGRIPEFTYTLVKNQKVLGIPVANLSLSGKECEGIYELPLPTKGYEVRDVYVIDIEAKDPKYPQSRKRIYMDKENLWCYYGIAWDRAGKPWKIFMQDLITYPLGGGQQFVFLNGSLAIDIQFGMASFFIMPPDPNINKNIISYDDVSPAALLKVGR